MLLQGTLDEVKSQKPQQRSVCMSASVCVFTLVYQGIDCETSGYLSNNLPAVLAEFTVTLFFFSRSLNAIFILYLYHLWIKVQTKTCLKLFEISSIMCLSDKY